MFCCYFCCLSLAMRMRNKTPRMKLINAICHASPAAVGWRWVPGILGVLGVSGGQVAAPANCFRLSAFFCHAWGSPLKSRQHISPGESLKLRFRRHRIRVACHSGTRMLSFYFKVVLAQLIRPRLPNPLPFPTWLLPRNFLQLFLICVGHCRLS